VPHTHTALHQLCNRCTSPFHPPSSTTIFLHHIYHLPPPPQPTTSTIFLPHHSPCVFLHSQTHTAHQHRCIHSCKMQSQNTTTPVLQFTHTPLLFLRWNKATTHLRTNDKLGWEWQTNVGMSSSKASTNIHNHTLAQQPILNGKAKF